MRTTSPFPGMDPWLEEHWGDLHHRIVQYCCDQLAGGLPGDLFAAVEETVYITEDESERWRVRPDTGVFSLSKLAADSGRTISGVAVAQPIRVRVMSEPIVEGHIEIRKMGGGEPLVTAIEILSPTNKSDPRGRWAYPVRAYLE